MQKIMVSIIILNVNEKDFLKKCLSSLKKMNFPYKYETIIVDNGSTDGSQDFIRDNFPYIKLIENKENVGFAEGNNVGLRSAKGKYILFLNNDTEVTKDWLLKLVKVAESDEKIGICAPKQLMGDKKTILYGGGAINYTGLSYSINMYKKDFKDEITRETAFASGAAFLIRKNVLDKIGAFDKEYFIYHEDVDLSWRVRLAGYKVMYVPTSIIYHYFTFKRRQKKMYLLERNRYMTIIKNYSSNSLYLMIPMMLLFEPMLFLYSLISGWPILKLKSYFYILENWGRLIKERQSTQKLRKVDDKEIIKLFTPNISFAQESEKLSSIASYFLKAYWLLIKNHF